MKNLLRFSVVFLLVTIFSANSFAQKKGKPFKGIITYSISYEAEDLDPSQKAQLPSEMKMYIKDGIIKQESLSGMGKQSSVADYNKKTQMILIDMMGNKVAIKVSKEDVEKGLKEGPKTTIEASTETKEIAGMKCKKVEVTDDKENTFDFYYTEDINVEEPNWATPYKEIKGILLEYSTALNEEITAIYKAKSITKGKVKKGDFIIPSGYKELTPDEAKAMFGGQ